MSRLTAKDFAPELLELYDGYVHGKLSRRDFLERGACGHLCGGQHGGDGHPRCAEPGLRG